MRFVPIKQYLTIADTDVTPDGEKLLQMYEGYKVAIPENAHEQFVVERVGEMFSDALVHLWHLAQVQGGS